MSETEPAYKKGLKRLNAVNPFFSIFPQKRIGFFTKRKIQCLRLEFHNERHPAVHQIQNLFKRRNLFLRVLKVKLLKLLQGIFQDPSGYLRCFRNIRRGSPLFWTLRNAPLLLCALSPCHACQCPVVEHHRNTVRRQLYVQLNPVSRINRTAKRRKRILRYPGGMVKQAAVRIENTGKGFFRGPVPHPWHHHPKIQYRKKQPHPKHREQISDHPTSISLISESPQKF